MRRNPLTSHATDTEVEFHIKKWFNGSGDRDGGRSERAKELRTRSELPTASQAGEAGISRRKEPPSSVPDRLRRLPVSNLLSVFHRRQFGELTTTISMFLDRMVVDDVTSETWIFYFC